ncbi:MAG TPA: cupredoxin domain-containing protein [Actinomycetota bacterium]|nr:cupredoxin domain-containing protein [Actinomycetota bacterium]
MAVAFAAAAAACSPGIRTVEVTIEHSRFEPPILEAAAGETVRFVIRNLDPIDHEFILGDQAVQDRHESGTEPHHGAIPGEVSVPAGAWAATTYRFPSSGRLLFGCHLPGHWAYGMRGTVHVA